MKIIPAPKLDKPGEERWPDNNLLLENDFNNNQQKQQQQPRQQQQRSPPYSEHHHHHVDDNNNDQRQQQQHGSYNNGETSPNDPNSNIMQQQQGTPKKRTRPVIRIKADRPPIRINSVGQIKLKAERQMRLKPKIRYLDKNKEIPIDNNDDGDSDDDKNNASDDNNNDDDNGESYEKQPEPSSINPRVHHHQQQRGQHKKIMTAHSPGPTRSKIIPEKYLQNMPPLRNLDDNINTPQSSPPQRTTSSSSYGSGGNGGKKYTPSSSMNYDQQQITRYNYKNKPTTTTMKTLKLSSPSSGHHQHQHHQHNIRSKLNDDNDNNGKFEPIYRPSSSSSKPSSSSSYSDSDSSGEESGSGSKSAGHRPMTIRTSEGLEQLEKNNYDKQLLKTLKNLMVTGGKRHKLDFEDKEEGEIHRIQSKGKIPEKYLKQFPSEDSRYHQQHHSHSHSSNSDQDPDLNNNNNNDNSDLDDNQSLGSTYQDYDTRNNGKLSNEPSYEDMGDDLNDDTSDSSDEHYESIRPSPTPQSQSSIRSSMIRRYRVKGYDPNYEYIGPEPNSAESEQINHHHHLLDLNDMEQPTAAITEQIGHDGRKVKTYVLSGVYRKKVDEILRNDHTDGDDDEGGSSYSSDHADESRQIVHFFKPNDNVVGDEQKLHDLLEKCDDDPNVDSNSSVDQQQQTTLLSSSSTTLAVPDTTTITTSPSPIPSSSVSDISSALSSSLPSNIFFSKSSV